MTASDKNTLNASRQERFLKAVELLDSAHSYTRLGAVHALVALADDLVRARVGVRDPARQLAHGSVKLTHRINHHTF